MILLLMFLAAMIGLYRMEDDDRPYWGLVILLADALLYLLFRRCGV